MDKISGLPDHLLEKILSFLPTKVVVSTCVLSKRWENLWMWIPKLEFVTSSDVKPGLADFINKKLPLHRAPVIESLHLHLYNSEDIKPKDIKRCIEIAVSRHVRELAISYNKKILQGSLFTSCKDLVALKLNDVTLMDVPSMLCLHSLKTLQLKKVVFVESLQLLLSVCPVLEELLVHLSHEYEMKEFAIIVPSLQSLTLSIPNIRFLDEYVIDTPCLKYLRLRDMSHGKRYTLIKNMPKLKEAYVDVVAFPELKSLIGSITSVKRLTICSVQNMYGDDCVFNQLEHLNLCVCVKYSWNLLGMLLKDSPNLRVLDIYVMKDHKVDECKVCWNPPSLVPECLLSSLQIFNWSGYLGRRQERDIAVYILQNAYHLKRATILADSEKNIVSERQIEELTLSSRASRKCKLVFTEDSDYIQT